MDSDRELLEWAAKAAGLTIARWVDGVPQLASDTHQLGKVWNPRTDNGQAFELAMLVDITVRRIDPYVYAIGKTQHQASQARFDNADDMMAAAREAVFMAAVELGKAM